MRRDIAEVIARHAEELMRVPGVAGLGEAICEGAPCIRVYLSDAAAAHMLPERVEDFPVALVVTGDFLADTPRAP